MPSLEDFSEGNPVKFVDAHHAMSEDLKKLEGCEGNVQSVGQKHNKKVLVHFNKSKTSKVIEQWWIKPERLELLE